nr:collagen alpha-1(I) chain-like [Microcebus murinus]
MATPAPDSLRADAPRPPGVRGPAGPTGDRPASGCRCEALPGRARASAVVLAPCAEPWLGRATRGSRGCAGRGAPPRRPEGAARSLPAHTPALPAGRRPRRGGVVPGVRRDLRVRSGDGPSVIGGLGAPQAAPGRPCSRCMCPGEAGERPGVFGSHVVLEVPTRGLPRRGSCRHCGNPARERRACGPGRGRNVGSSNGAWGVEGTVAGLRTGTWAGGLAAREGKPGAHGPGGREEDGILRGRGEAGSWTPGTPGTVQMRNLNGVRFY